MTPPRRALTFYRLVLVLVLPLLMLGCLVVSGCLTAYWQAFSPGGVPPGDPGAFADEAVTALL